MKTDRLSDSNVKKMLNFPENALTAYQLWSFWNWYKEKGYDFSVVDKYRNAFMHGDCFVEQMNYIVRTHNNRRFIKHVICNPLIETPSDLLEDIVDWAIETNEEETDILDKIVQHPNCNHRIAKKLLTINDNSFLTEELNEYFKKHEKY